MTKYLNKKSHIDAGEVNNWLHANLTIPKGIPVSVNPSYDGSEIESIEIGDDDHPFSLSGADKSKLISQYPELSGKEV